MPQAAHARSPLGASISSWGLDLILVLILVPHHPCSLYPNISNSRRMYTMILLREVWPKHAAKSFLPSLTLQICALAVATRSQVAVEERHLCDHVSEASLRISQLNFLTYSAQSLYNDSWNMFRYHVRAFPQLSGTLPSEPFRVLCDTRLLAINAAYCAS